MAELTQEQNRLTEARTGKAPWLFWGPYLSERQWGTVREDYSPCGTAWDFFPHEQARSRAYRWGEDGLAGISDERQRLCFAIALWNGKDPFLKERLFGLSNHQGNHGEDVKEYYFYLDNTPTHSYMKMLYKYPHAAFPYHALVAVNGERKKNPHDREFELIDTGVFAESRYTDVLVEYAKQSPTDILVRISLSNRGPEAAPLHLLPTLWFRNTWSWADGATRPTLHKGDTAAANTQAVDAAHDDLGTLRLYCEGAQELLFVDNETNTKRLFGVDDSPPYPKDGIGDYIVAGNKGAVNPAAAGTKAAAHYPLTLGAGETKVIRLRLSNDTGLADPFAGFDDIVNRRLAEADAFYRNDVEPHDLSDDRRAIQRQALAGMLWSKQFYYYDVERWLRGDGIPPPPERLAGRNYKWVHLNAHDVLSVPDKWEYPWFASWDMAFHSVVLALVDPDFAKRQLAVLTREWYMNPDGQVPAYEWGFDDVNPPVQAWAAWRLYEIERQRTGKGDVTFLAMMFRHCLLYFNWWVNRKDQEGDNLFQGGFLGLDNIGVFNRDQIEKLGNGQLSQSDGTSWMGLFALDMLRIALELVSNDDSYLDMAAKFFHHFLYIADSMNRRGFVSIKKADLWNQEDGFYYDVLTTIEGCSTDRCGRERPQLRFLPVKAQTLIGLMPLFPTATINLEMLASSRFAEFDESLKKLRREQPSLVSRAVFGDENGNTLLLSFVDEQKLRRILTRMLDEAQFLGPHGIRSVSKVYADHPYRFEYMGKSFTLNYEPAEATLSMFGGNSNWRGPVWFPINYLLIESLRRFHRHYGNDFKIECPTGSGKQMTLAQVADEISRRLIAIFERGADGKRPVYGGSTVFQQDPHWKDLILFYEYFHGDNGSGLGASHQTGWTGLVAKLIEEEAKAGHDKPW